VDAVATLVLSLAFLKEGRGMAMHAASDKFGGGACACGND
jgi:hypothetical protein